MKGFFVFIWNIVVCPVKMLMDHMIDFVFVYLEHIVVYFLTVLYLLNVDMTYLIFL
jgi:hypothetical protein